MPSSSWHLLHNSPDGAAPAAASPAATVAGAVVPDAGGAVFRGRQRGGSHGSGHGAGSGPGASLAAALQEGCVDPAIAAAELDQLARAAEERGYEAGRARAEAELRTAIIGAAAIAEQLQTVAPERTSEIAHAIAELALSVAKRIVQHEVRTEPSLLCASLEAAVSTINGSPEAHVLLNPAAVEPVQEAWETLHGRAYLGKKWLFEGDPTLPVGGCTLRYEHGFVEAGLESQLEEIGIALDRAIPGIARGSVSEEVA